MWKILLAVVLRYLELRIKYSHELEIPLILWSMFLSKCDMFAYHTFLNIIFRACILPDFSKNWNTKFKFSWFLSFIFIAGGLQMLPANILKFFIWGDMCWWAKAQFESKPWISTQLDTQSSQWCNSIKWQDQRNCTPYTAHKSNAVEPCVITTYNPKP